MSYTYYTKVNSYEHMLNCSELAMAYALFTTKDEPKPHYRLVAAILNAYYEEHPEEVEKIIREGSEKARIEAQKVLSQVRKLVKMY